MKTDNPVKNYMTLIPYHMGTKDSVEEVANFMHEKSISHLPLLHNNKLAGLVSSRDIKAALASPAAKELKVDSVMADDLFIVLPDHPLDDIVKTMAERKIGSCIVQEVNGAVVGIFTNNDALLVLSSLIQHLEGNLVQQKIWDFIHTEYDKFKNRIGLS